MLRSLLLVMAALLLVYPVSAVSLKPSHSPSSNGSPSVEDWYTGELVVDAHSFGGGEDSFASGYWVSDPDGVSTVLFRFRMSGNESWVNRTTQMTSGNVTNGYYAGHLTYEVKPIVRFEFKVFANDTLGNWIETEPMTVEYAYVIYPAWFAVLFWMNSYLLLIVVSVSAVIVLLYMKRRRSK